jgi:hypothetical protein
MRMKSILYVAAIGLIPGLAQAATTTDFNLRTTEDLYRVCSVAPGDPLRSEALNFCEGFLLGAVSYHDEVTGRENLKRLICYPATATRDQGIAAFVDWATTHQQDQKFMSDPAVVGAVRALAAKWPCKSQ